MDLYFTLDPATDARVVAFLQEHLDDMYRISPPESMHALNVTQLRQPGIRFWTTWLSEDDGDKNLRLVGTSALKDLEPGHAELKSMRVSAGLRGKGIAQQVLDHAIAQAQASGVQHISLETGTEAFFAPARQLYARNGFVLCEPFGSYALDPNSCFMTREIALAAQAEPA